MAELAAGLVPVENDPQADISGLIAALRERDNLKRPDQIFGTEDYEATRLHHAVPQRHGRFVREHNSQP